MSSPSHMEGHSIMDMDTDEITIQKIVGFPGMIQGRMLKMNCRRRLVHRLSVRYVWL